MPPFPLFFALMITLLLGISLLLPCIACSDRWHAYVTKRILSEKAARQVELLQAVMLALCSFFIAADIFFDGILHTLMAGIWQWMLLAVCMLCALASFFSFLASRLSKYASLWLSSLTCIVCAMGIMITLATMTHWVAHGGTFAQFLFNFPSVAFVTQFLGNESLFFLCFIASLFLGLLSVASVFVMCWHIACRIKMDYGRDFYTIILAKRAKFGTAVILCFFVASLILAMIDPLDAGGWASDCLSSFGKLAAFLPYALLLFLPLAAFLCFKISVHPLPLQKKSYAFFSLIAALIGFFDIFAHLQI